MLPPATSISANRLTYSTARFCVPTLSARQILTHPVHLLSYGFGAGLSPKAPGTMGIQPASATALLSVPR